MVSDSRFRADFKHYTTDIQRLKLGRSRCAEEVIPMISQERN